MQAPVHFAMANELHRPMHDGSVWTPSPEAMKSQKGRPAVLRRYYPTLIKDVKTKSLRPYEQATLASLMITKNDGSVCRAGVHFYLHHLGLSNTELVNIVQVYPCQKFVDKYGRACDGHIVEAAPCAQDMLCPNCDKAIRILGGCWHLPSMADVVTAVFVKAVESWTCTVAAAWWPYDHESHDCGPDCRKNPHHRNRD
jgi:hypothetical protein